MARAKKEGEVEKDMEKIGRGREGSLRKTASKKTVIHTIKEPIVIIKNNTWVLLSLGRGGL